MFTTWILCKTAGWSNNIVHEEQFFSRSGAIQRLAEMLEEDRYAEPYEFTITKKEYKNNIIDDK